MATVLHEALAKHTGFLLSRTGLLAQKRVAEQMESLELTPRMWGALNVLAVEGAITQQALCQGVGIDPSSMVGTIDELEDKGLVERRRNPADRRAHALHLTPRGREVLAHGRKLIKRVEDELLAPLEASEREQLRELLLRIVAEAQAATAATSPAGRSS